MVRFISCLTDLNQTSIRQRRLYIRIAGGAYISMSLLTKTMRLYFILSLYNSPDNQHYRADYRVFSHNTMVAILPPQTTALLHLGAGDGVTNRPRLLRLVVQRKGHVRRDFGYQSQSSIVDRFHQRM